MPLGRLDEHSERGHDFLSYGIRPRVPEQYLASVTKLEKYFSCGFAAERISRAAILARTSGSAVDASTAFSFSSLMGVPIARPPISRDEGPSPVRQDYGLFLTFSQIFSIFS